MKLENCDKLFQIAQHFRAKERNETLISIFRSKGKHNGMNERLIEYKRQYKTVNPFAQNEKKKQKYFLQIKRGNNRPFLLDVIQSSLSHSALDGFFINFFSERIFYYLCVHISFSIILFISYSNSSKSFT